MTKACDGSTYRMFYRDRMLAIIEFTLQPWWSRSGMQDPAKSLEAQNVLSNLYDEAKGGHH